VKLCVPLFGSPLSVAPYHVGETAQFHQAISHELVARGVAIYAEPLQHSRKLEGRYEGRGPHVDRR
jgi:hypothetical protein